MSDIDRINVNGAPDDFKKIKFYHFLFRPMKQTRIRKKRVSEIS